MKFCALFASLLAAVAVHSVCAANCTISSQDACPLSSLVPSPDTGSSIIFPGGKTRCAFDTAVSGKYVTNQTYFFEVFPSPQPDNHKLLIYFQGGGACVDDQTCSYAFNCASPALFMRTNAHTIYAGILNRSDPDNAFKDWNIVHVPYCTGDLHSGNRVVTPDDPTIIPLVFPTQECMGKHMTLHQNGAENTKAVLSWAIANFPSPSQIVVSGSSAGALGAQLQSGNIASLWRVKDRSIPFAVLPDSYVGILPPSKPVGALLNMYGTCSVDLGLPQSVVSKCENKSLELVELITSVMNIAPTGEWLMLNSNHDMVQREFYGLVEAGLLLLVFHMPLPEQFNDMLTKVLNQYQAANPHFKSFVTEGEIHSFFTRANWETSFKDENGKTMGDTVSAWLDSIAGKKLRA